MSEETTATLYGLSAVLLWSTVATAFKLGLVHFSPPQLLLIATVVSLIIFWGAAFASASTSLSRADLRLAALLGVINPFAYYLVLFEAYDRLPAQIAQPLNYTWAVVLAILAVPVLGQKLSGRSLTGIIIAYAGVVILLYQGEDGIFSFSGVALALGSTLLWAGYWLMNTRTHANPVALMAWSFTFALPLLVIWCMSTDSLPTAEQKGWEFAVWVGVVEMGVTFLLWQQSLKRTRQVARISQLIFLAPFLSLLLIGGVLGEEIRAATVIGLAIIVGGVVLTQSARPNSP